MTAADYSWIVGRKRRDTMTNRSLTMNTVGCLYELEAALITNPCEGLRGHRLQFFGVLGEALVAGPRLGRER
jgi:hypothetical protein